MIHHARGLPKVANAQEPNTYVKVYLKPDPTKVTKRKTKVVKKNCHPSFMEMVNLQNESLQSVGLNSTNGVNAAV